MDFVETLFEGMRVQERREMHPMDSAGSPDLPHNEGQHYVVEGAEADDDPNENEEEEKKEEEEEEEVDDVESGLCNLCRSIDWKFILSGIETPGRTERKYHHHVTIKLHSFRQMLLNSRGCSFCRLVSRAPNVVLQDDHLDSPMILWYTNRAPWRLPRVEGDNEYDFDPCEDDGFRLLICDFQDHWPYHRTCEEGARISIMVHHEDIPAERRNRSGRIIPSELDLKLINKWWASCNTHHRAVCWLEDDSDREGLPRAMRFIDVLKNTLVETPKYCRYVALSYVWGKVPTYRLAKSDATVMASQPDGLRLPVEDLPRTILDAMEIVKALGETYLWVDTVCIVQDDADEMQDAVSRMDFVYRCAALTIVAAAGDDANAGLHGVRPKSRQLEQVCEKVEEITVMHAGNAKLRLLQALRPSKWNNRGWTLQEDYFAQRQLIFTSGQVFYECKACAWCEDQFETDLEEVPELKPAVFKVPDFGKL